MTAFWDHARRRQEVTIEPVVDRLPRDTQLDRDRRDRASLIQQQEGQAPAKDVGVVGGVASLTQPVPLLGCEAEVHRTLPCRRVRPEGGDRFHHRTLMRTQQPPKTPEKQGPRRDTPLSLSKVKRSAREAHPQSLF